MFSMTSKTRWKTVVVLILCLAALQSTLATADDASARSGEKSQGSSNRPTKRIPNKDPRKVFLLQISDDKRKEIEVKNANELLAERIYERHESKFPLLNKETNKIETVAIQVLDITGTNKRFLDKPRRALKVGSVVPGSWLGLNSKQRFILTKDGDRYVDRFKTTDQPIEYTMLHIYDDDRCEEVKYYPDDAVLR
ncbi:MAG: hypothetical protein HZA46_23140 [Planctomycetales bacterium]|nr:hypothetical protein [Planctomycetales bacterium]